MDLFSFSNFERQLHQAFKHHWKGDECMSVRLRDNLWGYFFIGPFIIGFLAFTLIPIVSSLYFSFTSYDLFSAPKWIGLDNFKKMFTDDPRYLQSLKVTFIYVFGGVPLRLAFALLVAMLLNTASRAVGLYRTMYYLPSLIGGSVAVAIMWRNIFGDEGIINILLQFFVGMKELLISCFSSSVLMRFAGLGIQQQPCGCLYSYQSGNLVLQC